MDCSVNQRRLIMFIKKMIPVACLAVVLGFASPSTAQVTDAVKKAGHATEQAGKKAAKTTGEAAKKVGSGVKEGAETVGTETKHAVTGAPKGATGLCKDGTYTKTTARSSACSKHGGVQKWF
jgi:hypothetical protein